jgi:hypothetical protein
MMGEAVAPAPAERRAHRAATLAATLALLLLVSFALYWPTRSQPYFWDDVPHYEFATSRTFAQVWTDVRGLSYYRPFTFSLYKVFFELLPVGASTLPHIFILIVHGTNGWLVGGLTRRLLSADGSAGRGRRFSRPGEARVAGFVAGLLFVVYPYAALPVAHFAAVMHPLATLLILGSMHAALSFADAHRRRWMVLALMLSTLAAFTHESGVMAGTIVAAALLLSGRLELKRHLGLLILLAASSALFLPVWALVPKTPNTFEWLGWGGMAASATFFAQGPSFPLQPLSRLAMDRLAQLDVGIAPTIVGLPWWDLAVIWAVALVAFLVAALMLRKAGRLRLLGVALAWTFLAALPSIVALPFPYVSVSQRLLYSSGPAAAVLWGTVCALTGGLVRSPSARKALVAGLTIVVGLVPVLYVRREVRLHELALQPLDDLAAIARQYDGARHLVVNPPNWVNHKDPWYALGQEGVSVSAEYIDLDRLVRVNSGTEARFAAATFPEIKAEPEQYYYSTIGEDTPWDHAAMTARAGRYDQLWLTAYDEEEIAVISLGQVRPGQETAPDRYIARFADRIFLATADLKLQAGNATAILEWRYLGELAQATVFRHILDCEGQMLGQADGFALGGTLPFQGLAPGREILDVWQTPLERLASQGCYTLRVGLYLPDGSRVEARTEDGARLADDAASVSFSIDTSDDR